jgi:hypothetical protein
MNAYELAKYLDRLNGYMDMPRDILDITQPSANMLRQQARRIEELEQENSNCKYVISLYEEKQKPIAWMFEKDGAYMSIKHIDGVNFEGGIPLYTTPQTKPEGYGKAVPLSDEEILNLCKYKYSTIHMNDYALTHGYFSLTKTDVIKFARAIEVKVRGGI